MKLIKTLTLFAFFGTLFSCGKEVSTGQTTNPPSNPPGNDSIVLSMYVTLDTTRGRIDTLEKTSFSYDNLNRISSEFKIKYNNNAPIYFKTNRYYYNGSDTLVNRIISTSIVGNNPDSIVTFFQRNSNLNITKDSSITYSRTSGVYDTATGVNTFLYYTDSIIQNSYFKDKYNIYYSRYKFTQQTKSGGNITSEIFQWTNGIPGNNTPRTYSYKYDNRINPFGIRKINYPVSIGNSGSGIGNLYCPANNLTEYKTTESSNSSLYISSYIYNSLGLPKTVVTYDPASPSNYEKGVYIYTK
jgi:hypothetical protein